MSQATLAGCASLSSNDKLAQYIAGLVEGDGSIKLHARVRSDKGNLLYPSVTIVFAEKDLPLAEFVAKILKGTINKASGD